MTSRKLTKEKERVVPYAVYEAMCGDRARNRFLSMPDLGIDGVFQPIQITVKWKPNTRLDVKRAEKMLGVIKDAMNKSYPNMECCSVKLLTIATCKSSAALAKKEGKP